MGVATTLRSTASRGHRVLVAMGGSASPGQETLVVPDPEFGFTRKEGAGTFGLVTFRATGIWGFAPGMLLRMNRFVRGADFVSIHSIYSFPVFAGYLLARLHRKPYGVWPAGVFAPIQRRIGAKKKWLYDKLVGRRIADQASVFFFSAGGEREEAKCLDFKAPSVIIADGFDSSGYAHLPAKGSFRKRYLKGHEGPLVLFLARLNPKKGLDLLAQTMRLVAEQRPDVRLAIVGPPDPPGYENEVRAWIKSAGIESKTVLTGMVDFETKLQALADADAYVLPSYAENFGFSVFEAMASGVPVVVSDSLNYAREIASAQAGFSLTRDPKNFADVILTLLGDPALRRRMGENGAAFSRRYSIEETAIKVERTIESILQGRPLPIELVQPASGS